MSDTSVKITALSEIPTEKVKWLWHPYIPYSKLTIVQGDPGDGKTTFVLAIAALLTTGQSMPEHYERSGPATVIYQTAEDGLGDTIKPRLESLGADCERVVVIDESGHPLSFSDGRFEAAINKTGAKLLILDPLQAYIGMGVDMHRANEIRPLFSQLSSVAGRTGCAIVLIGHMNKIDGMKGLYRGLGSIDIAAAARSVLLVGRAKDDTRVMAHVKSSLAEAGQSVAFSLDGGFRWLGYCDMTADDLLKTRMGRKQGGNTKQAQAEAMLLEMLESGAESCTDILSRFEEHGIGRRTVVNAKQAIGVQSFKKGDSWYWRLPKEERNKL